MKLFIRIFLFLTVAYTLGCQSLGGAILKETPLNISETRRAIVMVIGQPRSISENGREILSKYYDRKGRSSATVEKAKERLYTHVVIFGDRRPYDIQIEVLVESKTSDDVYELSDRDDKMAEKIAAKIKEALDRSQNNRNVIDDFKPL